MDQVCPKEEFPPKTEKVNITILRIQITTFQFKLTILIFFYQICPNREFPVKNGKIALVRASMIATYYNKLFHKGAGRHNVILMSLVLLVAETTAAVLKSL